MTFVKGARQSAKFQTNCSGEVPPNLYFDRLFWLKVYKISAEKVQRSYVSWHWRVVKNLKKSWFLVSKMTRIWLILIQAIKSLKNLHFDLKKNIGVIFYDTEESCKIEERLTCGFEYNIKNLANFHQNTWQCQNWYFHGILLSKVENAWAKNLQRSYA